MVADLNVAPRPYGPVTLNLFQGLSCSESGSGTNKWMLKQVQHDGVIKQHGGVGFSHRA
jgi:hypothetical protein